VHELWATFDFLMPNFLGSESSFITEFAKPIINGQRLEASTADMNRGMDCLKILHQQVLPFVLRREKGQVMKDLPPKIITDIPCVLTDEQGKMYKRAVEQTQTKAALEVVEKSIKVAEKNSSNTSAEKLGSNVLASLLQLRLICTHPMLYTVCTSKKQSSLRLPFARLDSSGKLMALNDLLRHSGIAEPEIAAADNDSSGFLIETNEDNLTSSDNEYDILIDDGYIEDNNIDREVDEIESPPKEQSKCLIFAQFTQSLDVVEKFLFEPHMPSLEYLRLDGSVPSGQRSAIVDQFNEDVNIKVLLLTTKVGGLGLNLTGRLTPVIFLISSNMQAVTEINLYSL
jgi:TATA-binding protein-associated factor